MHYILRKEEDETDRNLEKSYKKSQSYDWLNSIS
jgi:hypothetical protein